MDHVPPNNLELNAFFDRLFPSGLCGADVREEIAPDGWCASPLLATPRSAAESGDTKSEGRSADPERAACECVAACLWDIFSANHEVFLPDGRQADIGSFRGAAGFLAEYLNAKLGAKRYDYLDFYMGTIWRPHETDLSPVYCMIFHRLRREGCDWHYRFPRLSVINLCPPDEDAHAGTVADGAAYSPSAAVEREQDRQEKDEELVEFRERLDELYVEDVTAARQHPPPVTVQAYHTVFGHYPQGWPP